MTNQEADISMKKAFAAMGGMSEDESENEEETIQALMVESDSEEEEEEEEEEEDRQDQKKLHMTKMEAEHSMRWTRSSILLDSI
ncbi:hypothetical protein KY285_023616 [Solanum tuberosum]|nr:hypothetical protein KY289_023947 [Solanum tuberosum]KAH0675815.1 hypothetical protein KY285_023616 [Solanum tuberosum]